MKIITKDAIYVEEFDILYLNASDFPIPTSIMIKAFEDHRPPNDDDNKHIFIKYTEDNDIDFLKKCEWIIDYNKIRESSKKDIDGLIDGIIAERNLISQVYLAMSEKEKRKNGHMITECELLNYKIRSIREAYLIKEGKIVIKFPVDIEDSKTEKTKGINRILKRKKKN